MHKTRKNICQSGQKNNLNSNTAENIFLLNVFALVSSTNG